MEVVYQPRNGNRYWLQAKFGDEWADVKGFNTLNEAIIDADKVDAKGLGPVRVVDYGIQHQDITVRLEG